MRKGRHEEGEEKEESASELHESSTFNFRRGRALTSDFQQRRRPMPWIRHGMDRIGSLSRADAAQRPPQTRPGGSATG